MPPEKTTEWNEGRAAYEAGEPESKCPYGMLMQWTRWADWVCGYGEAKQEAFAKNAESPAPTNSPAKGSSDG